jgi:formamidopyrimidine-DNA glycosylase
LKKSIAVGGDSMSDFRNIKGEKGNFQKYHNCYKMEKKICGKKDCKGLIEKKKVGSRIARFCPEHQILF